MSVLPSLRPLRRALLRGGGNVLFVSIVLPAGNPVTAAEAAPCIARLVPAESQNVTCPIDASMIGRPMRFVAQFVGSHDDTRLALTAALAGEPLACAAGSRTRVVAEDGEVALDCRFTVAGDRAPGLVLEVTLAVHHAQFVSAQLGPE